MFCSCYSQTFLFVTWWHSMYRKKNKRNYFDEVAREVNRIPRESRESQSSIFMPQQCLQITKKKEKRQHGPPFDPKSSVSTPRVNLVDSFRYAFVYVRIHTRVLPVVCTRTRQYSNAWLNFVYVFLFFFNFNVKVKMKYKTVLKGLGTFLENSWNLILLFASNNLV